MRFIVYEHETVPQNGYGFRMNSGSQLKLEVLNCGRSCWTEVITVSSQQRGGYQKRQKTFRDVIESEIPEIVPSAVAHVTE